MVLVVIGGILLSLLNIRAFQGVRTLRLRIAGSGVEGDVLFACLHTDQVLDLHAEGHQIVAERLTVAEPGRHLTRKRAVDQLLRAEDGEPFQLALLQLGIATPREGVEDHCKGCEQHHEEEDIGLTESHVASRISG